MLEARLVIISRFEEKLKKEAEALVELIE